MTPVEYLSNPSEQIVLYPDPVLLSKTQEVTDFEPWEKISTVMFKIMVDNKGWGLAAPQIGLPYSLFTINVTKPMVIINPEIVEFGDRMWEEEEKCLSIPDCTLRITRPRKIKAKWIDLKGKKQCASFEGWTSKVFQHEYDHLFGILINGLNRTKISQT